MKTQTQTQTLIPLDSEDTIVQLADLFRLMGYPTRLRIILVCLDEPISVGNIARRGDSANYAISLFVVGMALTVRAHASLVNVAIAISAAFHVVRLARTELHASASERETDSSLLAKIGLR